MVACFLQLPLRKVNVPLYQWVSDGALPEWICGSWICDVGVCSPILNSMVCNLEGSFFETGVPRKGQEGVPVFGRSLCPAEQIHSLPEFPSLGPLFESTITCILMYPGSFTSRFWKGMHVHWK